MSITLRISEEARISFLELLSWYVDIDVRLGVKFSDEYYSTLNKICQSPTHYSFIAPSIRKCSFPKMQSVIIYTFKNNVVDILLVKDTRSKPNKNFY